MARYSVPPPSLHKVQRLFWESVAVRPGRDSIAPALVRLVRGADDNDRKTRIRVYSDAYYLRLRDVLREDFARVAALLGSERFENAASEYLEAVPSTQPSVRHLGRPLAEFLGRGEDMPNCLANLADAQWTRVEAFYAPAAESATIGAVLSLPPG